MRAYKFSELRLQFSPCGPMAHSLPVPLRSLICDPCLNIWSSLAVQSLIIVCVLGDPPLAPE